MWLVRLKISSKREKFCTSVSLRRVHEQSAERMLLQPVAAIQSEYSLMERAPEQNGVLKTCEELGIGFVPWGPVGMGYLTGKIDARTKCDPKTDLRSEFDRFTPENLAANMPVVDLLRRRNNKALCGSPTAFLNPNQDT